jgi:hypothetical protein
MLRQRARRVRLRPVLPLRRCPSLQPYRLSSRSGGLRRSAEDRRVVLEAPEYCVRGKEQERDRAFHWDRVRRSGSREDGTSDLEERRCREGSQLLGHQ